MDNPTFREDHSSQIPALQLLIKLGYTYLSTEEALILRGGKTSNVLLEPIVREQLKKLNAEKRISSTRSTYLSEANIENGIRALRELPFQEGYIKACETAYERLTLGKAVEQSIDGDVKSFTLQYIDWKNWDNNVFHVTEEYSVMRSTSKEHYRLDIVLFVNGIPLSIIECKRPDMKEPIAQAISQHTRNQHEDGIRHLYAFSQLLMCVATFQNKYATTDTKAEYWAAWKEAQAPELKALVNTPLPIEQHKKLFADRAGWEKRLLEEKAKGELTVSPQDEYIYNLCRPERLIELSKDYILFEGGLFKKIARYQQYFSIKKIIARIQNVEGDRRQGGVVWHTQGSGKSLTMALLARKIHQTVKNPKIVLVTDRVDLDNQITTTFGKVRVPVQNAKTGSQLVDLLKTKSDVVVTTVINKFEAAVNALANTPLTSPDIFVLIDEGHRTQYGTFNVKMEKVLPNACFLAFTGTPLMKKERSTAQKFGGIIDAYTILEAVEDGAIVPILYEGRHAVQDVNQKALDKGFDRVAEPLTEYQAADLKKKYSRANLIGKTEQRIHEIAQDISDHYTQNWGLDKLGERSGFKAMVVTPDKATAVRYKKAFDLIGKVTTEVIMSPPDDREGNDSTVYEPTAEVVAYWKGMESKYGKDFEKGLINRFKTTDFPELLIVVDKLLTGFDEPRVIALYVCRKLREHTLLQAIARVNRVAAGKEYGFVIDYEGIIGELDEAMNLYTSLDEFEEKELEGTFTDIRAEIEKLPQAHTDLQDMFKALSNKLDEVSYARLLEDEALRVIFYQKLSAFARLLKLALSSIDFERNTPETIKEKYKKDIAFYIKLRNIVVNQHTESIDFKQYEKQLQKLLDQHVITEEVIRLTEQVSILDTEAFEKELAKIKGNRAVAETIASRTAKHISENMDEDPVFYKRLSDLIKQTIADLRAMRISDAEAVKKLNALRENAINRKTDDTPNELAEKADTIPFYRLLKAEKALEDKEYINFALETDTIIRKYAIVDWEHKPDITRKMSFFISEYLIDELKIPIKEAEALADECITIAKKRYKQ